MDRFGNLISNLTQQYLEEACSVAMRRQLSIRIGERIIEELVNSYSEGLAEKPCALINSNGRLEVFLKEASAADLLHGKGEANRSIAGRFWPYVNLGRQVCDGATSP